MAGMGQDVFGQDKKAGEGAAAGGGAGAPAAAPAPEAPKAPAAGGMAGTFDPNYQASINASL